MDKSVIPKFILVSLKGGYIIASLCALDTCDLYHHFTNVDDANTGRSTVTALNEAEKK